MCKFSSARDGVRRRSHRCSRQRGFEPRPIKEIDPTRAALDAGQLAALAAYVAQQALGGRFGFEMYNFWMKNRCKIFSPIGAVPALQTHPSTGPQ